MDMIRDGVDLIPSQDNWRAETDITDANDRQEQQGRLGSDVITTWDSLKKVSALPTDRPTVKATVQEIGALEKRLKRSAIDFYVFIGFYFIGRVPIEVVHKEVALVFFALCEHI